MTDPIPDNPEWGMTDAAHPAWWRGYDYGADSIIRKVNEILDGKDNGSGVMHEPMEGLRRRLMGMVHAARR